MPGSESNRTFVFRTVVSSFGETIRGDANRVSVWSDSLFQLRTQCAAPIAHARDKERHFSYLDCPHPKLSRLVSTDMG